MKKIIILLILGLISLNLNGCIQENQEEEIGQIEKENVEVGIDKEGKNKEEGKFEEEKKNENLKEINENEEEDEEDEENIEDIEKIESSEKENQEEEIGKIKEKESKKSDDNLEEEVIIKEYYNLMEKGKLKKAFEMRLNSNIDLETFKSWYKELESTEVKNIKKDGDKYNFNVILEFEDKTKEKYEVVSKVEGDKIENISSEKVSILYEELGKSYYIENDGVYRKRGTKFKGADANSFKILECFNFYAKEVCYKKDINNVYYKGIKMDGADPKTFESLKGGYAKDLNNIYIYGEKIDGADSSSFEILGPGYAKDKNNIFYQGDYIEGVDFKTFNIFEKDYRYSKDENNVYFNGEKINGSDSISFEFLNPIIDGRSGDKVFPYTKDKNNVYRNGVIQEDKDPETFDP